MSARVCLNGPFESMPSNRQNTRRVSPHCGSSGVFLGGPVVRMPSCKHHIGMASLLYASVGACVSDLFSQKIYDTLHKDKAALGVST